MSKTIPPNPPQVPIGYGYADAPRRANGPAIASLVLGILGCIPIVTGLFAIVLGLIGLRRAHRTMDGGKGMAVAGLTLGIISVLAWIGFGGLLDVSYRESKPAGVVAKKFLADVSTGNTQSALNESTDFTAAALQSQSDGLKPFGPLTSVSIMGFNYQAVTGRSTMTLNGVANFAKGTKSCIFTLVKLNGTYKVESYRAW